MIIACILLLQVVLCSLVEIREINHIKRQIVTIKCIIKGKNRWNEDKHDDFKKLANYLNKVQKSHWQLILRISDTPANYPERPDVMKLLYLKYIEYPNAPAGLDRNENPMLDLPLILPAKIEIITLILICVLVVYLLCLVIAGVAKLVINCFDGGV